MRLKRIFVLVIISLVSLALIIPAVVHAVQHGQKKVSGEKATKRGVKRPAAEAQAVWTFITETKPYTKYKMWPGKSALYQGTHPHGAFLTTYVDSKAFKAIQQKKGTMPIGALIVKENYTPEKQLAAITVMYKSKKYDPANSDWFYAKYAPGGKVEASGKVEGCISCHKSKAENDFLFTGPLK